MSLLAIHPETGPATGAGPGRRSRDPAVIAAELARRGIGFERWPAQRSLAADADEATILRAYAAEIARVRQRADLPTVDAIRVSPGHPEREALRQRFLAEHTHAEDEVRFFVEGRGLFCLHLGEEVLQLVCGRGDWIAVPAGTRHWFDMGSRPHFCALRFYRDPGGWQAAFTGSAIAGRFPGLDDLAVAAAEAVA